VRRGALADDERERKNWALEYEGQTVEEIVSAVTSCSSLYGAIQLLGLLWKKKGGEFMVGDLSVNARLEILNKKAGSARHWAAVR